MEIKRGDRVRARTATKDYVVLRAASGVESGQDFPIVWLFDDAAWEHAQKGEPAETFAWPADAVDSAPGSEEGGR